jgi:CubicO group peptidase (beta-lactamase class C family)
LHSLPSFKRGDVTLENWRTHPYSRWSFQNASELVPSAIISHGTGAASGEAPARLLDEIAIEDAGGEMVAASELLARSYTDSCLVLRKGEPVAAWNAPHSDPRAPHLIFSVSKSITGLAAGIAHGEGLLDPEAPVTAYLPGTAGSTYGSARVRDLLDMTVDLDFDEAYLDLGGAFDRYRRAMLWNPERAGTRPETMEQFLATLPAQGHGHGRRFHYASPNTDLLGLVIERATGIRLH